MAVAMLTAISAASLFLVLRPLSAQASPNACRELTVNGGFEATTLDPWRESSAAGFPLLTHWFAHSGDQSAWLGGYENASDYLTQTLTLPAGITTATLQLWVQIDTLEATNAAALDFLTIEVRDQAGAPLSTVASLSNQDYDTSWRQRTYDLPAYARQTVQLVFHATGDAGNSTDFHVDDVSLAVCAADQKVFMPWLRR